MLFARAALAQWQSQSTYVNPATEPPSATIDNRLWHLDRIDQAQPTTKTQHDYRLGFYEYCSTGQGIVVYVIDTGVWGGHKELAGKVVGSRDFSVRPFRTEGCNYPFDASVNANLAHGTSVASLIAGVNTGAAKGVEIVSLQVSPCPGANGQEQIEAMIDAVEWIGSPANPWRDRFSIVNFSTWVADPPDNQPAAQQRYNLFLADVASLHGHGIPVIASANNYEGNACESAPAVLSASPNPGVISVGGSMIVNDPDTEGSRNGGGPQPAYSPALPTFDARWSVTPGDSVARSEPADIQQVTRGSNFGDCVTLFAPARSITSAIPTAANAYRDRLAAVGTTQFFASGTSWAAPLATGVAARFLQMYTATRYSGKLLSDLLDGEKVDLVRDVRAALLNNATPRVLDPATINSGTVDNNFLLRATDIFFLKTPNAEVAPGSSVTLHTDPVTTLTGMQYQWYRVLENGGVIPLSNGSGISGAFTPSLTIDGVSSRSRFFLRATGQCGSQAVSRDSRIGLLRLKCPSAPSTGAILVSRNGESVTLTATGTTATSVRWYRRVNNVESLLPGTGLSLTLTPDVSAHYWYRVGPDTCFADSNEIFVGGCNSHATVSLTSDRSAGLLAPSTRVTLTANVTGAPEFARLRWFRRIDNGAWADLPDITGPTLQHEFTPEGTTRFAEFKVAVVSPYCNAVESAPVQFENSQFGTVGFTQATSQSRRGRSHLVVVRLTSATAKQVPVLVNVTTASPVPVVVTPGQVSFPVSTLTTQERTVTVAIPSDFPEGGTITLTLQQPQNAAIGQGTHTITVSDSTCSGLATMTISGPTHVVQGQPVTLSPSIPYTDSCQWFIGSTLISTNRVLVHTAPPGGPTTYRLVVVCGDSQREVTHTVYQCYTPGVNVWPAAAYLHAGDVPQFEALAAGATPLTYAWYRGSIAAGNQIGHQVAIAPGLTAGVTQETFHVKVTDPCGLSAQNQATAYRCLPTFSALPTEIVVAQGGSTTLTVNAPALAYPGQSLPPIRWFAGDDYDMTTPLGEGSSFTATLPAGTASRSYFAGMTGLCGTAMRKERTPNSVLVRACSNPQFINYTTSGNSTSPGVGEVRLLVNATGAGLTYQWYKNGALMSGKTGAELIEYPTDNATYHCAVTSEQKCTIWTNAIPVSVCATPNITFMTANHTFWPDEGTRLDVTATQSTSTPLTYQWYALNNGNWVAITNATQNYYITGPLSADVTFKVIVRAGACADERTVTVTKCIYPRTVSGRSENIVAGDPFSLTLPVISPVFDKQVTWYERRAGGPVAIASGTNASTTVYPTTTTSYYAEFTHNGCKSTTGDYIANVCVPRINSGPSGATILQGQSHVLTVNVTGGSHTYQWFVGTTSQAITYVPTLTVTPGSTTSYWVRIHGCAGTYADSGQATVVVCVPPSTSNYATVANSPQFRGNNASVTVVTSATSPTVQWERYIDSGSSIVPGATSITYNFTADVSAYYWANMTACGVTTHSQAVLHIVHPQIQSHPQNSTVKPGDRPVLTVSAYGTFLSYQWYVGNSGDKSNPVNGATSASFETPAFTTQTSYWCEVKSAGVGYAWSNAATISRCTGPTVTNFTAQWPGYGACYYLYAYVSAEYQGNVIYQWYQGTPGNTAASTFLGETGSNYMAVCPTAVTTYWARVWTADRSCFSDTGGAVAYPLQ